MNYVYLGLAFVAGFLLVFGLNLLLADLGQERRKQVKRRLDEEFRVQQRERARQSLRFQDLSELAAEGYAAAADNENLRQRLVRWIEQAGLRVQPWQVFALCGVTGTVPSLLGWIITGHWMVAVLAFAIGGVLPLFGVRLLRAHRQEKMLSQLPDAFELMSRMLRAGQTVSQSLQGVADEFAQPIAAEFGCCYEQQNLGLSPDAAMRELARRTGLLEIKIFVVAVTIHRQAGGNLSQLLEKLAGVIRDRQRIRGQIKSLTAEGRLQAMILLALPPLLLGILLVINPGYASVLFQFPWLLIGMFVAELTGALWMRRIVHFDF